MFDLSGKAALVTGASGGIGGAIARALHKQGATVTLSGTRADALEKLKGELGERREGRRAGAGEHHRRPLAMQRAGDGAADAARGAGHQRGLAGQVEHASSTTSFRDRRGASKMRLSCARTKFAQKEAG